MQTLSSILPGQLPSQDRPDTLDTDTENLFKALPVFAAGGDALAANLNSIAAGGAYALSYVFDTATAAADPGPGKLRLNNAAQNTATAIYLDLTAADLVTDYTGIIDTMDSSTSTVKGQLLIYKAGDKSKYIMFDLTARATPAGYRNLTVTPRASSAATPFVNGDALQVAFQRTGDKGATGANGSLQLLAQATVGTVVANIDFLNLFSAAYDRYVIDIEGVNPTSSVADQLYMRLANGGTVDTGSNYNNPSVDGSLAATTQQIALTPANMAGVGSPNQSANLTVEVRNANDGASRGKGLGVRGVFNTTAIVREGRYVGGAVSGFRLYWSAGTTFASGTVRVYGVTTS